MNRIFTITLTMDAAPAPPPVSQSEETKAPEKPRDLENPQGMEIARTQGFTPEGHAIVVSITQDLLGITLHIDDESMQSVSHVHLQDTEHLYYLANLLISAAKEAFCPDTN